MARELLDSKQGKKGVGMSVGRSLPGEPARRYPAHSVAAAASVIALALLAGSASSSAATKEIRDGAGFEAAVESLAPGDVLIVHQGTYADSGRISVGVKGTASAPVVVQGAPGETRPLITRRAVDEVQNTINIEGATYLSDHRASRSRATAGTGST